MVLISWRGCELDQSIWPLTMLSWLRQLRGMKDQRTPKVCDGHSGLFLDGR